MFLVFIFAVKDSKFFLKVWTKTPNLFQKPCFGYIFSCLSIYVAMSHNIFHLQAGAPSQEREVNSCGIE